MRYLFHTAFLFLFSAIQPTLLGRFEILGAKPNLFLVYIVIVSFFCSRKEGMTIGFVFGFILDLFIGRVLGLNAVLMLLLSYCISCFCEKIISKNNFFIVAGFVIISTFFFELVYYIIAYLGHLELKTAFVRVLLPEILSNTIFSAVIYFVAKKTSKRLWNVIGEGIG